VLIVADTIESYVTRYYDTMSFYLRVGIVLISVIFIIWYFIIYPLRLKNKRHGEQTTTT
jgi:hypothetical protein